METEIKLRANAEDLPQVLHLLEEQAVIEQPTALKHLESRYFDTPDFKLYANHVALRVRRTGDGYVQTIKTKGDAGEGLLSRGEWEKPVPSFDPDLTFSGSPLDLAALGSLSVLFKTEIDREKTVVSFPPGHADCSQIEVALDRGQVTAGDETVPITEVELELVSGQSADLFELGRRLAEALPLCFDVDSKSARGYRLATGGMPQAEKAIKLTLDPTVTLEDGFQVALKACVRQWFANQTAAFDGRDIEGVHQMRVALRRLRSAFVFFKALIPEPTLSHFRAESRWIASSLGPARDWDVFLAETLPPLLKGAPRHPGLMALYEAARTEQDQGYDTARIAMTSPRYSAFVLQLCGWIERKGWRESTDDAVLALLKTPMVDYAGPLLERRYKRVRKAGDDFDSLTLDQKHELRIAMKKLRYAGDFFRSLYPKDDVRRFRRPLTAMLDDLGKLNDLAVAQHLCATLARTATGDKAVLDQGIEVLLRWYGALAKESEAELAKAWNAFAAAPPYWKSKAA